MAYIQSALNRIELSTVKPEVATKEPIPSQAIGAQPLLETLPSPLRVGYSFKRCAWPRAVAHAGSILVASSSADFCSARRFLPGEGTLLQP